jgi:hypothetical protein
LAIACALTSVSPPAGADSLPGEWDLIDPGDDPLLSRYGHVVVIDPAGDRLLLYGGERGAARLGDVWTRPLAGPEGWTQLAPGGEPAPERADAAAVYDPVRGRVLILQGFGLTYESDVWELRDEAWHRLVPAGPTPPGRAGHGAIHDPAGDRVVVFGGRGVSGYLNDVWQLTLSEPPTWTELHPVGTPPPARMYGSVIHDDARRRLVLFGGQTGTLHNDVWALTLDADPPVWTQLPSSTEGRSRHTAVFDPLGHRMVVYGGLPPDHHPTADVLAYDLIGSSGWTALATGGSAGTRAAHAAAYDGARDRMLAFGGLHGLYAGGDLWSLDWGRELVGVAGPSPRIALRGFVPNPARGGAATLAFTLADDSPARLEVIDLAGRLRFRREVGALGGGTHRIAVPERLGAGVYFVRLTCGRDVVRARSAVIR